MHQTRGKKNKKSRGYHWRGRLLCSRFSVWTDLRLFFGEVFHYRFYFSIQCDTSGGYNLIKEKMGRNKVKYRGPSTGLNRIMY